MQILFPFLGRFIVVGRPVQANELTLPTQTQRRMTRLDEGAFGLKRAG